MCNDLNITNCYVGHTTEFRRRKNQHKSRLKMEKVKENFYVYQ